MSIIAVGRFHITLAAMLKYRNNEMATLLANRADPRFSCKHPHLFKENLDNFWPT